jgi:hypothetical protein
VPARPLLRRDALLPATVPPGFSERCQEGLYARNGVCTARTSVGQSCASTSGDSIQCVAKAYCNENQVCVPVPAQRTPAGGACLASQFCELGTSCLGGTCRPPAQLGAACNPSLTGG